MENNIKEIACVGCLSKNKTFFGKKGVYSLYKCLDCGMISLYDVPNSSGDVYDKEYFSGGGNGFGYVNYDEDKEPMREGFKKYLDLIEKMTGKKGRLFDVGAATGFFMSLAKDRGFDVSGVELSDFAAEQGRRKGLDIVTGSLPSVSLKNENLDVVTLLDVLEHMPNPEEDIKVVHNILKKGGITVINTPDSGSVYAKLMRMNWHLIIPPEHINYFNEKGIRSFLERNGFEVLVVTRVGKKFTTEYIFNMLFKWLKIRLFQKIATILKGTYLGRLSWPTDFRDNMFVLARKK